MKALILSCSLAAFACGTALAAESPWVGTWKLDVAKSNFTGDTFTYSKGANGLMHFSDGSTTDYDFAADGKPYKTYANRVVTWTADGKDAWNSVYTADGKVLVKVHRQLSSDGKTLSLTETGTRPDGSAFNDEDVYTRVSGGPGLLGTWRNVKASPNGPLTFVIASPGSGVLHYDIPDMKATAEAHTDGSDTPLKGPEVAPGMAISIKALAPNKIQYVMKLDGKPQGYGTQTIAADGHSFTDVSWSPGKESEKQTAVYVKQ